MKKLVLVMVLALSLPLMSSANNGGIDPLNSSNKTIKEWLNTNIVYPNSAIENKEEGIVYVSFMISEDGNVENVKVVQGISNSLDNEALNAVNNMPVSELRNNYDSTGKTYILPIKFILK